MAGDQSVSERPWLRAVSLCVAFALLVPGWPSVCRADSGGYSRPGSYGGGASMRRPSMPGSGGYARPSGSGGSYGGYRGGGGDTAISRRNSGQALNDYRTSINPPPRAPDYGGASPGYNGGQWGGGQWGGSQWGGGQRRPEPATVPGSFWGRSRSAPQGYAQGYPGGQSRYGVWDAVLLWSLLNAVTSSRSDAFFRQNQSDPGYQQWRADADRLAANDPALKEKLSQLDNQLSREPPPPAPPTPPAAAAGTDAVLAVLVVGAAGLAGLWVLRRKAAGAPLPGGLPGISGSAGTRFRVGMTVPLDPSAFVLAGGVTKVTPPAEGALVSVEAVGLVRDGTGPQAGVALHRLYLPQRTGFFQLHLDASGQPDECRYFSALDEVNPASRDEWAFWLDPAQGMIGWPEFQTRDGKLYGRAWAPGSSRVPPRDQTEMVRDVSGDRSRSLHAMLYAGHTGANPPAPGTEYILVQAVEQDGQAWVEVLAGIDINPAALALPPAPLS